MDVAVLLLIWRRPIHVKKVINSLRIVSPKKIYISSDGPIKDDFKNKELVESTREIVLKEIDWDCEKICNFSKVNKGCKVGVSDGIDWFFSYEEEGIILEDDCFYIQIIFSNVKDEIYLDENLVPFFNIYLKIHGFSTEQ